MSLRAPTRAPRLKITRVRITPTVIDESDVSSTPDSGHIAAGPKCAPGPAGQSTSLPRATPGAPGGTAARLHGVYAGWIGGAGPGAGTRRRVAQRYDAVII